MEVRLLKWEKYAVDEVLSKEKELSTPDTNTRDKYEVINRRMDYLNDRLKGVEKKIDRLLDSNRANLFTDFSARRQTMDFTNPILSSNFANLLHAQRKTISANDTITPAAKVKQEEPKISTRTITNITNPTIERSFISPVDVTPKLFTSKSVLLDPNADPDLLSK